ncbi:MAG: FAD-dependent oxidoreductase, partial [Polyangiaceae bacterium]
LDTRFKWAQPGVIVTPLGAFVLCVFTSSPHARSADPVLGAQAYNEVTFFVPVIGTKGGVPFTGLHVPYIYPDSGIAVANGREIFGLPKKPANKITVPFTADFVAGSPLEATTTGTPAFTSALWTELPIVGAKTASGGSPSTASAIVAELVALGMPPAFATIESLMKLHLLQTKEVADVDPNGVPKRELYRALTWTTTGTTSISGVTLLDSSTVKVNVADLASDPIRSDLGLASGDITPIVSLSYTMDFFFGPAEVWKQIPSLGVTPLVKTRVLILGGGLAGLATALQLTSTESYRERFEVKVVAQGHRLGGKGGSWRSPDPRYASRIEEHGIHVIFGFYHNFLRMLRGVYEDAERNPTTSFPARFSDAFSPRWDISFDDGTHQGFEFTFPKLPDDWGTGVPSPADFVKTLSNLLYRLLDPTSLKKVVEDLFEDIKNLVLPKDWTNPLRKQLFEFTRILVQGTIAEIALSAKSFDDFDGIDFRAWMKKHGASDEILNGPICQIPYDGVFAYAGPDTNSPLLAAGLAIRGLLRLSFFYESAPYFVMNAGMGEAVFAPIYEVLKGRGVEIDFFTKVIEVHMAGTVADKVVVQRQATITAGPSAYAPLVPLTTMQGSIPTWARDFDPAQLDNAALIAGKDFFSDAETYFESTETFSLGADYDHVVCALPAPVTAKVLTGIAANAELSKIASIETVSTIQVQAWLEQKIEDLGWKFGGVALGGFMQPLDMFLECSRLLPAEPWPGATRPLGLLYACGPFTPAWGGATTDPTFAPAMAAAARTQARAFMKDHWVRVLPGADAGAGELDFGVAYSPAPVALDRFDDVYVRANTNKSDQYVYCAPGALIYRPRPTSPSRTNLHFAGDWTRNGIDVPCMEGVTMSALTVVEAITGEDQHILAKRDWI